MRVAMVSPWGSARCGIRSYTKYLVEELSKYVELWIVPHYRYALPDRGYVRWLAKRVLSLDPDVVHVQHEYGIWNPIDPSVFIELLQLLRERTKIVITMHSTGFGWEKAISELVDAVIVHNRYMYGLFQGSKDRVFIIPHGCRLIDAPRDVARRRLGIDPSRYIVGVFGFIDPRKGHDVALEVFARLRQRIDVEMVFVGGWHTERGNPYMLQVMERARELGVRVTGFVDDHTFELWMSAVDVVLHPARAVSESGIVSLALGAGKPVVVFDHPAFLGKPVARFRTLEELVTILERLADLEKREELSRAARRYAEMFSWSKVAWLHYHLYRWVLHGDRYSLVQLNGVKDAHWQLTEIDMYGSPEAERDEVHRPRHEWVRARIEHPCVDIGSSYGYLGCEINIDIALYRAALGKTLYPDREFIVADAHTLPLRSGGLEQALLCEVLEHVENPLQVLREASRAAKGLLITVPDESSPYRSSHSTEHVRFFTRESLMELVERVGLEVAEYEHVVNRGLGYAWHCIACE